MPRTRSQTKAPGVRDNASSSREKPFGARKEGAVGLPEAPQGFRWTRQRREIYQVLQQERDHPTATELFLRAKAHIPGISLATVYNCLETLTHAGLVKQVNFERNSSRYCPNLREHAHFYDEATGRIVDVELRKDVDLRQLFDLPEGVHITRADISLKGVLRSPAAPGTTRSARATKAAKSTKPEKPAKARRVAGATSPGVSRRRKDALN